MFFDIFGALCSLLSTYYFITLNNKAWLIGIIATLVNGWLYWHKGIYADMALEFIYFLSMGYGLYQWQRTGLNNKPKTPTLLNQLSIMQWGLLILLFMLLFCTIFYILTNFTHSSVALMDAVTTSLSLFAQWLMCHKIIITWLLWFITDILYAFLYFNKGLPFHCILMFIYTGMAIIGYLTWVKKTKQSPLINAIGLAS